MATLQVRLDNKTLPDDMKTVGSSLVKADGGNLYLRRVQNDPNSGSWKDEMLLKGRPDTLFVNIFNRRRVECRNPMPANTASVNMPLGDEFEEGNAPVGPQQPQLANTTFEIDLSAAYLGDGPFELKLEYRDNQDFDENDDRRKADMLTFISWEGLDRSKILVTPIHVESLPCIKLRGIFHQFAAKPANQAVNVQESDGFWNFISTAWAKSDWRRQKKFIRTLTRRGDQRSKSRINSYFEQKKEEVAPVSTSILADAEISDEEKARYLETLLQLPVNRRPRSRAFLDVLIPFVTHPNFKIRRNAARLLRAADYVNDDVAAAFEDFFKKEGQALAAKKIPGRDYSAQYLAVAAGRDIFYNKGISEIQELRRKFTALNAKQRDAALKKAVRSFSDGRKYARYAPADRRVLFSKLDYGTSMAYFSSAAAEFAAAKSKATTYSQLKDAIFKEVKQATVIPSKNALAARARNSFRRFIDGLGDQSARYSWQHHIAQAKKCLNTPLGLAFDCMQREKSG